MTGEYVLAADGLGCHRCERLLERELDSLAVVADATVDADAGRIRVRAGPDTEDPIVETVRALGYRVTDCRRRTG